MLTFTTWILEFSRFSIDWNYFKDKGLPWLLKGKKNSPLKLLVSCAFYKDGKLSLGSVHASRALSLCPSPEDRGDLCSHGGALAGGALRVLCPFASVLGAHLSCHQRPRPWQPRLGHASLLQGHLLQNVLLSPQEFRPKATGCPAACCHPVYHASQLVSCDDICHKYHPFFLVRVVGAGQSSWGCPGHGYAPEGTLGGLNPRRTHTCSPLCAQGWARGMAPRTHQISDCWVNDGEVPAPWGLQLHSHSRALMSLQIHSLTKGSALWARCVGQVCIIN